MSSERHPHRRRGPWAVVLAASIGFHVVLALIFASVRIYEYVQSDDAQFETPPPPERIDPLKLEYQVQLRQRQQDSATPRPQRILVNPVSELNPPPLEAVAPPIAAAGVSLDGAGRGQGGGGLGAGFGRTAINLAASQVNFFGIRSRAERVLLVVDYSRYMVEDPKGGIPAFRLVKAELEAMVRALAPGTLFNVAFVQFETLGLFKPQPVPALDEHKAELGAWLAALRPPSTGGSPSGTQNYALQGTYEPLGVKTRHWARAVQAGTEMGVDAIFMITPRWHFFPLDMTEQERLAWQRENRWGPEEEAAWQAAEGRARAWLNEENAARRAQGRPPRVVNWIGQIIREREPSLRRPPPPNFEPDEVLEYVRKVLRGATATGSRAPSLNIVLFLGRNEDRARDVLQFEDLASLGRGRLKVLQGFEELKSVTTVPPPVVAPAPGAGR